MSLLRRAVAPLAVAVAVLAALALTLPSTGSAAQVAGHGWTVDWPLHEGRQQVAPGTLLRVGVAPASVSRSSRRGGSRSRRASARATVTLTRLAGNGRAARVLVRKRLSRGVVRVRIPRGAGPRYVLAVRGAGGVVARAVLRTAAAPRPTPPRPVTPPRAGWCGSGVAAHAAAATMTADRTSVFAGERLTLTIANTGGTCLSAGYPYAWERQTPSGWERVDTHEIFILPAIAIEPGRSWSSTATVADATTMPPGHYRIRKEVDSSGAASLSLTAEVDVLPRAISFGDGSLPAWCVGTTSAPAAAAVTFDRPSVHNGEQVVATIANTGGQCLRGYGDTALFDTESPHAQIPLTPAPDLRHDYLPGGTHTFTFTVPPSAELPPGRYDLRTFLTVPRNSDAIQMVVAEGELEVVEPTHPPAD